MEAISYTMNPYFHSQKFDQKYIVKMFAMLLTTFDEFIYLDLDVYFIRDVSHMFDYMSENRIDAIFWSDIQSIWLDNPFLSEYPEGTH